MGRLIDADELVKMVDKHTNDDMTLDDDITCILENVQTAYDVDKVVEQLENKKHKCLEEERFAYEDAIRIVKKGGK